MTPLWKGLAATAALVFVASAVWLVIDLMSGDGVPLLALAGLIAGGAVLLLARAIWLSSRGVYFGEVTEDEIEERADVPSAPVWRGGGGSFTGTHSASGGAWTPPPRPKEEEPEEEPTFAFPPPAVPLAPPLLDEEWDEPVGAPPSIEGDELSEDVRDVQPRPLAPEPAFPQHPAGQDDEIEIPPFLRPRMNENVEPVPRAEGDTEPIFRAPEPDAPAPAPESEPIPAAVGGEPAEQVLFSAYYPREVKPDHWQPLRAYMLKEFAAEAVQADARAAFGPRPDIRATSREALQPVPEDALVTALPVIPGFEFDPPQHSLRFRGDWRRFDFEFRAQTAPLDASADGRITFLVEGVIVADVPLSVYVSESAGRAALAPPPTTTTPYQAIFCSYSHKDSAIVERVERASRYFNFVYLRDVTTLRSGESWNARLLEMIDNADIFQLFWSPNAAASEYVRQEYMHAASLRSQGVKVPTFIRPIRWEEPMSVPPPAELSELHFDLILELAQDDG